MKIWNQSAIFPFYLLGVTYPLFMQKPRVDKVAHAIATHLGIRSHGLIRTDMIQLPFSIVTLLELKLDTISDLIPTSIRA